MGGYQILIADRDPQSLHEERRNSQLESEKSNLDERVLNMGVTHGTKPKKMAQTLFYLSPSERIDWNYKL